MHKKLKTLLEASLEKIRNRKIVLFFSGGIDSSVLAKLMKEMKIKFRAVTVGAENSQDLKAAKTAAAEIGIRLGVIKLRNIKKFARTAVKILGINPVYVSIAIPEIAALSKLRRKYTIVTGLGSDELFAGYQSHQDALAKGKEAVQKECRRRIKAVKNDVARDKKLAKYFGQEIYFPFLDKPIIRFGLTLKPELKISKSERKIILRRLAEELGLSEAIAKRPKKAMQYGSGSDKLLKKLARKEGFKNANEFLNANGKHFSRI
jgi:asparagine synthase (glutamine-hydrolysing)